MERIEAQKKLDQLKKNPELAGTDGFIMDELLESADAPEWFGLLMAQPQFAPPFQWWQKLRCRCDLPWADLLMAQPQFANRVHWESVSRLELVKLAYMALSIFQQQFPKGRPWDLYAFLTPLEKSLLLSRLPQLENLVDWDELDEEWETSEWMVLLTAQPQFEKYFDWSRIEKKPSPFWEMLLRKQPQFACHCDLEHLEEWQVRRIRKKQPQLFEGAEA